jgi:hypothetical protein
MLIAVSLYLRGEKVDPDRITKILGVTPSRGRRKGQTELTSTNQQITAKTGVWRFSTDDELDSPILAEHIELLRSRFGYSWTNLSSLPDVQEAYVDIFMAVDAEKEGTNTCHFTLTPLSLLDLQQTGLPTQFTVAVIGGGV